MWSHNRTCFSGLFKGAKGDNPCEALGIMLNKLLLFLFLAFLSSQSGQGSPLAPLCFELHLDGENTMQREISGIKSEKGLRLH